jgi:hypothetical protein
MRDCCKTGKKAKKCKRKDGKVFNLPRRFTKKRCLKKIKGFTMIASCAPYKYCKFKKN